jgi:hypothetical protein
MEGSPASLVLPLVYRISPASAFRLLRHSGTAGYGLFRDFLAMKITHLNDMYYKIGLKTVRRQTFCRTEHVKLFPIIA